MSLNDQEIHTLKTPLTVVIGYAEALRSGDYGAITSDQREAVDVIVNRSREMLKMLSDIYEGAAVR
jgi:signal transduction histidine kinase